MKLLLVFLLFSLGLLAQIQVANNPQGASCTVGLSPNLQYTVPVPNTVWSCTGSSGPANGSYTLFNTLPLPITRGGRGNALNVPYFPRKFSLIGDSRVAQLNLAQGYLPSISGFQFFNVANALNGHNMQLIANYGLSGQRSDQFLSANLATALADSSETLIFGSACVNDIGQATASSYTDVNGNTVTLSNVASLCASNIQTAANQALAVGKGVIITAELGGTAFTTNQQVSDVLEYNERMREYADATRGVIFWDPTQVYWLCCASTTGIVVKSGYSWDGTHPSTLGAYYMGKQFAALMSSLLPPNEYRIAAGTEYYTVANTSLNFNPNFKNLTTGTHNGSGTVTGNVPLAYNISAPLSTTSVTVTSAADPNGYGNDVTLAITATAADTVQFSYQPTYSYINPGMIIEFSADVSVAAGSSNFFTYLAPQLGSSTNACLNTYDLYSDSTHGAGPTEAYTYHMRTMPCTVAGTITYFNGNIVMQFTAAGSATVTISRVNLRSRFQ